MCLNLQENFCWSRGCASRLFGRILSWPIVPTFRATFATGCSAARIHEANEIIRKKAGDFPDTPLLRAAEILVIVRKEGKPVKGATFWLLPGEGQSAQPLAERTASDGRAWFVTAEPGKWVLFVEHDDPAKAWTVQIKPTPMGGPGYDHLLVVEYNKGGI